MVSIHHQLIGRWRQSIVRTARPVIIIIIIIIIIMIRYGPAPGAAWPRRGGARSWPAAGERAIDCVSRVSDAGRSSLLLSLLLLSSLLSLEVSSNDDNNNNNIIIVIVIGGVQ